MRDRRVRDAPRAGISRRRVLVGAVGMVFAVDARTGVLQWVVPVDHDVNWTMTAAAPADPGTVYAADMFGDVIAVGPA